MESIIENKRKPGREKGCKKTGGRKPGTPNKSTLFLRGRLQEFGCNFDQQLAEAIITQNYQMINALQALIPYIQPKFREIDMPKLEESPQESLQETSNLISIISNESTNK